MDQTNQFSILPLFVTLIALWAAKRAPDEYRRNMYAYSLYAVWGLATLSIFTIGGLYPVNCLLSIVIASFVAEQRGW